jgi:hypothetical protein
MGRLAIASFLLCLALATGARANCYVLQNNTDQEQKWGFSYDTEVGPGQIRTLTLAPHGRYPSEGQWCWDRVPWKASVRVDPGYYSRSWSGAFVMGDGEGVSSSGVYTLEPPADVPPSRSSSPKAAAKADKTKTDKAEKADKTGTAASIGAAPSISCVDEICDVLFQTGRVAYTDTNQQAVNGVATIVGFKGPGSISCMPRLKQPGELCVVVDSTGQTWKGPMRPGAGAWTPWTTPPQE